MLEMKNWRINASPMLEIGIAGENNARLLKIDADEPSMDYAWKLEIEHQQSGEKNIVDLNRDGNILSVLLTRDMIRHCGVHYMQVRGVRGEEVKKSNRFYVMVGESISASDSLPPLPPSEFAQMEARITALKTETEQAAKNVQADAERAASAADRADAAATSAEDSAEAAGKSEATAQTHANNAASSAGEANTSAYSAAYSEESALSSKKAAKSYMDSALSHRNAAEEAVGSAVQAATDAAGFASAAEKSKNSAANNAASAYKAVEKAELCYNGASAAADRAENAAIHQPYPDASTGTWWVWDMDAGEYVDTGLKAVPDALHIAGPNVLGGVQPVAKTDAMTIPVGVDAEGGLHAGKDPDIAQLKNYKIDKPEANGTAGQVLGLDSDLHPKWIDQNDGMGDWKLLKAVICNGSFNSINIDKSDDGESYNCNEILITIMDDSKSMPTCYGIVNGVVWTFIVQNDQKFTNILIRAVGGKLFSFVLRGNDDTTLLHMTSNIKAFGAVTVNGINRVGFTSLTSTVFPDSAEIKLYGR